MPSVLKKPGKPDIAKRRCVMILNVLSGRLPVSDAIEAAGISRAAYYQQEAKALQGMLEALEPTPRGKPPSSDATKEMTALRKKVESLQEQNRRLEKLVSLTSKILDTGSVKASGGRKRKKRTAKETTSKRSSPSSSKTRASSGTSSTNRPASPSTKASPGGGER